MAIRCNQFAVQCNCNSTVTLSQVESMSDLEKLHRMTKEVSYLVALIGHPCFGLPFSSLDHLSSITYELHWDIDLGIPLGSYMY